MAAERVERNQHMKELRDSVNNALVFVEKSKPLELWRNSWEDPKLGILARIIRQVTECCRFLRAYADEARPCRFI